MKHSVELPAGHPGLIDLGLLTIQIMPFLVEEARLAARLEGDSWRGYQVGSALAALAGKQLGIYSAGNFKPYKDGPRVCAEETATDAAESDGFGDIFALATTGEPQLDGQLDLPYLPQCDPCVGMMQRRKNMYSPRTLSMLVHPLRNEFGLYTVREMTIMKASGRNLHSPHFFNHSFDPDWEEWRAGEADYLRYANGEIEPDAPYAGIKPGPDLVRLSVTGQLRDV
ncbi:MAG: hypothetical protein JWN38_152 [Candidatus Saccharibacteria bacterium]|nr:hypothetical protein [Candidatus Saccharibacteria bacterium]